MRKKSFPAAVLPRMRRCAGQLITAKDRVLVGLSGGVDSVCLLHFLHYYAQEKNFCLAAVHVNHGLRGAQARADAAFCRKLCKQLHIEFFYEKAAVKKLARTLHLSPEHAARKARYEAFARVARVWKASKLALAHQADDQAETFLLNLLRGTHAKGLCGIPLRRPLTRSVEIIRPLLYITRAETQAYIDYNALPFVTDESNKDETFTRNWIRHQVLPLLEKKQPQLRAHIAHMAEELSHVFVTKNNPL